VSCTISSVCQVGRLHRHRGRNAGACSVLLLDSNEGGVRTQETSCSSDSRFRRKLSGTTGHRLLRRQRPQMVWLTAWVWFSLTTEVVVVPRVNPWVKG